MMHGRARRVDLAQELEDAAGGALVEVAGGLVGDEHERIVDQRARERHALLLAAGQLARKRGRLGRQPHLRERARHLAGNVRRAGVPITSSANATFASAVRSSSSRKSWKTMPSRRRSLATSRCLMSREL